GLDDVSPVGRARRIASVSALVRIIVGGLDASERAALEALLAACYLEDAPRDKASGLRELVSRASADPALQRVGQDLARFEAGPNAWLFDSAPGGLPGPDDSLVYSLAGLPEDIRPAAMFIVLDRIWTDLTRSWRKTLVVVDEAWWLM